VVIIFVILSFVVVRPLTSPWHPFIAGDGLGYYSYLPAKFIHNDPQLDFKWFNRVHNANYIYSAFDNPEENLLVDFKGKKINKYYQGLSFLWMPFFVAAHVVAKIFHYPPDGFSPPYQAAMGFASVFYLLLGLWFLQQLLLKLFQNGLIATLCTLSLFFGTYLFNYSLFANTLSHTYSFTFVTGFLYYSLLYFQADTKKSLHLLLALFCLIISFCIRPLNVLIILAVPAVIPSGHSTIKHIKETLREKLRWPHLLIIILSLAALCWQLWLNYIQTGSLFAYTYTDEKFNFSDARFTDALFSYHMGLFVYVPLFMLSFAGYIFIADKRKLLLPLLFFGLLFLYSAWWYWPITKRAMIDFYALPAIGLGALLKKVKNKRPQIILVLTLILITVAYFQLKSRQIRDGILDEFLTHKDLFWEHFFRLRKAHIYPIPPQSILEEQQQLVTFEDTLQSCHLSAENHYSGKKSLVLDNTSTICRAASYEFPELFIKPGIRKIRISMKVMAEKDLKEVHVFLKFVGQHERELLLIPFYIGQDYLLYDQWDGKEFGYDLTDRQLLNNDSVKKIEVLIWNVEPSKKVFIDELRTDFLITNRYFETLK